MQELFSTIYVGKPNLENWEWRIKPEPREWWIDPDTGISGIGPFPGAVQVREVM